MSLFFKRQALLVIGGGLHQIPVIEEAQKMGIFVVVMDGDKNAPAKVKANDFIFQDISQVGGVTKKAFKYNQKKKITGVLTVGTDFSYSVNAIKRILGLPGSLSESVSLSLSNKIMMREKLTKKGFLQPRFMALSSKEDLKKIEFKLRFPVVIKPADSMGARGVRKIDKQDLSQKSLLKVLLESYEEALKFSKSRQVLVEEFIEGEEISIDALIFNKKVYIRGIADRIIEYSPFFVETGHIIPSLKNKELLNRVKKEFTKIIRALGIISGAAKGDVFINKQGSVVVGEIAHRLSGGFMSTHTYPLSSKVNLMRAIIEITFNRSPTAIKEKKVFQVVEKGLILPVKRSKVIKSISGIKEVLELEGIKHVFFHVKIGDRVFPPRNNLMKLGSIIMQGKNLNEINFLIKKIILNLNVNKSKLYISSLN